MELFSSAATSGFVDRSTSISTPSSQFIASALPSHHSSVITLNFANVFQSLGNLFCTDFKYSAARPDPQHFILHKHDEEYSEGESVREAAIIIRQWCQNRTFSNKQKHILISRPGLPFSGLLSRGCPTIICQASSLSSNPRRSLMRTISKPLSGGVWARRKKRRNHLKRRCPATNYGKNLVTNLQIRIQPEEEHSTFLMEVKDQSYLSENNLKPLWDQVA